MDVLSEVLSSVRLASEIYMAVEMSAPWGVEFPDQPERALFYVVSRGSCYIEVEGLEGAVPLVGGDLVMLPTGAPHTIRDMPTSRTTPVEKVRAQGTYDSQGVFYGGGGGVASALIVGRFRFVNRSAVPILSSMPKFIRFRNEAVGGGHGLDATLRMLSAEAASALPGKEIMMDRLADVLFIQMLRAYVAEIEEHGRPEEHRAGLVRALMDPELARALALMHAKPEHPWTVAELAQRVGMSRTAFATRFKAKAGVGPLEHLTQWRVQKACELLREGRKTLDEVAWRVGYESAAAFSRAFRRETNLTPGEYRKTPTTGPNR